MCRVRDAHLIVHADIVAWPHDDDALDGLGVDAQIYTSCDNP